ncbi:MAG: hypothetical protein HYY35_03185 [Deltaproteobacteria bacterium]|nr:hypothetical protein [Deltaproteobacteria bacterium]
MQDRPTTLELLEAAAEFLEGDAPAAGDAATRYKMRVVVSVLRIVAREIELGERHLREEADDLAAVLGEPAPSPCSHAELRDQVERLNRLLAERIRAGAFDSGAAQPRLLAALRKTAVRKLEISNPRYLEGRAARG